MSGQQAGSFTQLEEIDVDFRVSGLPHAVVKEAEHLRVQELVKKVENHLHREALHVDLQQINVYNPFSESSKELICELGNVELFELCVTIFFNGIKELCTALADKCLNDSESRREFTKLRLDALSVPNYVMEKGPNHGARHVKTEAQKEYHMAWNTWKRCCKNVDSQGELFTGIHDRFLRDPVYRESQLAIGWTEQKCKEWDELAKRRSYVQTHSRAKEMIPRTMVSSI